MLSQISWTLFVLAIAVAAILYYTFIAVAYYPKETLTLLLGKKNRLPPGAAFLPAAGQRISIMGAAQPEMPAEDYLKRYQPVIPSEPPSETAATAPVTAQGPKLQEAVTPVTEDEKEPLFMVASDRDGFPGIEIADLRNMTPEAQLLSNVSDLMESIQTLLRVIRDGEGNTDDVTSFFPSLLAQYPLVSESKYRYSINLYIHDNCMATLSDALSLEAINALWCFPYPPKAA